MRRDTPRDFAAAVTDRPAEGRMSSLIISPGWTGGRPFFLSTNYLLLRVRDVHHDIAARSGPIHCQGDPVKIQPHNPPLRVPKHHDRYFPSRQILLIPDSFGGREQKADPSRLRRFKQLAVRNPVPPSLSRLCDLVTRKRPGDAARGAMVKENEHL